MNKETKERGKVVEESVGFGRGVTQIFNSRIKTIIAGIGSRKI